MEAPHDWYQAKTLRQLGALLDQFKAEGRLESESHYLSVQKPFILPGYGQFIVKGQPQDVVDFFEQATNHAVF